MRDLRDWLQKVEDLKEVQHVKGANWELELGAITALWGADKRCLLFDDIPGYPKGFRVLTHSLSSFSRIALTFGIRDVSSKADLVVKCRNLLKSPLIAPREVDKGPVFENVDNEKEVDLYKFPAPKWHAHDGGRFLGTGCVVITRDPDTGWVNLGTYRVMIQDANHCGVFMILGKHGRIMLEKYKERRQACPIAISLGHDPLLFLLGGVEIPFGVSEYDLAGGIAGEPLSIIKGPLTGLPIPATAEIVLEGEIPPGAEQAEGPFGEWTGYYGGGLSPKPLMTVKRVAYRNDPIILGAPPGKPPSDNTYFLSPIKAAGVWNELEQAGLPGIKGVWEMEAGGGRMLLVVAIQQMYPGHSKQVGNVAAQCHQGGYSNGFTVMVEDDIDPTNLEEVTWAVCTRVDLERDINVVQGCWTSPVDPMRYPLTSDRDVYNSRAIIDACRPWERRATFPMVAATSREYKEEIMAKWESLFKQSSRV